MRRRTSARRLAAIAWCPCLLVGLTGAQFAAQDTVVVDFDGVAFALETSASDAEGWRPSASDWQSSTAVWTVDTADVSAASYATETRVRVAVRNTASVPASVTLSVEDPDPSPGDLFDALELTVAENGRVLAEGSAASTVAELPGELAPDRGDYRMLDVTVRVPVTGDDRWADARTGVQLVLEGATL